MMRTICLHGPESTGKSTLAPKLAGRLGGGVIEEFGRDYAEATGTDFSMADLVMIAQVHAERTRACVAKGVRPVILDTDPLMTAVWADMLFGKRDPWFDSFTDVADFYLLFVPDLPWVEDGTRMFGDPKQRLRFFELCRAELIRRKVRWALVQGEGDARLACAMKAIANAPRVHGALI